MSEIKRVPTRWKDKQLKYPSNNYPQSSNEDLPKHFSVICIVGSRGSGKTALITQLLKQYEGTVRCPVNKSVVEPRYVIVSPTIEQNKPYFDVLSNDKEYHNNMTDDDIQSLVESIQQDKYEWEEYENYKKIYDKIIKSKNPEAYIAQLPPAVYQYFENIDFQEPKRPEKERYVTYMVCDDIVGTDLLSNRKTHGFKNLVIKSRHHSVVIIMCVQALKEIPRSIRMNVSTYCLGKYAQPSVIRDFHEECCADIPITKFEAMYNDVHKKDFSFLCIDHSKPKKDRFTDSFRYKLLE
jgi:tRNA A37 threonylcarbamoyladenosine biosynthesis protein TsaE